MDDFELLYDTYHVDIHHFIMRLCGYQQHIANDLTQETFLQAFLSLRKFSGNSSIKTWLIGIAKNVFFAYLKNNKKQADILAQAQNHFSPHTSSLNELLEDAEVIATSFRIIANFPPKTANVMALRIGADMPFEQIAHQLGISAGSARVLYSRGKKELIHQLKEIYHNEI